MVSSEKLGENLNQSINQFIVKIRKNVISLTDLQPLRYIAIVKKPSYITFIKAIYIESCANNK